MAVNGTRPRSARARGLRTLQHQILPAATRYAVDTEVWFRGLLAERAGSGDPRWATKDQVHDEAIATFLQRHRRKRCTHYSTRTHYSTQRAGDEDVTFWLDSKLMERARRMADRDGVKLARVVEAALSSYVALHVPADFMAFRHWVQQQAWRVYASGATAVVRAPAGGAPSGRAPLKRRLGARGSAARRK